MISYEQNDEVPLDDIIGLIPQRGVDAAGVMHTHAELVGPALAQLRPRFDGPLLAYPDSGAFEMPNWRFVRRHLAPALRGILPRLALCGGANRRRLLRPHARAYLCGVPRARCTPRNIIVG